jgi:hypothetical protein
MFDQIVDFYNYYKYHNVFFLAFYIIRSQMLLINYIIQVNMYKADNYTLR